MKSKPAPRQTSGKPSQPEQQIGEGSYEGARDYRENIDAYLQGADVAADAKAAKPANAAEAAELKHAEDEGRSHSKSRG
ncbi:hypothetical protein [Polaromonas sp.]|uniref:hypothetical protein n=1 Tax=Polaromonas sp. TaxID=1869339 RepID=UPI00356ADD1D